MRLIPYAPAILLALSLPLVSVGCHPDDPEPNPEPAPVDCATLLADWDVEHGAPVPSGASVILDPGAVRDPDIGVVRAIADGNSSTGEIVDVGSSVILRLDEPRFLDAIRYSGLTGEAAVTDFQIYLSPSTECWGEPVASGSFDGTDGTQEVAIDGRAARYVRLEVLGATGGASAAAIGELSMMVGASVTSTPDPNAVVGVPWRYNVDVMVPGTETLTYTLVSAPAAMAVDDADGVVSWTPAVGDEGAHDVVLRIIRGPAEVEQRFSVTVAGVRRVGGGTVPAGGGTVVVDTSMEGMGPMSIEVTVDDPAAPAGMVEILVVEGETAAGPVELTALGRPFTINTDLPPGTSLRVRIPLAGIPGLPAMNPEDSVFVTAYPRNVLADGPGFSNLFGFWDVIKEAGAVVWDVIVGDPGVYQINEGVSVVYEIEEFKITYMLDMGEDTAAAMASLRRVGEHVVASREYFVGEGCRIRANQPVIIHALSGAVGMVDQVGLVLELDKNHVTTDDDLSVRSTVAHELFHVFQIDALGGGSYPLSEFWWIEGTAAYMEDEVFDTDDWQNFYGPFDVTISRQALKDQSIHYNSMVYWKSLKAQRGFNACRMIDEYATTGEGLASLSNIVGGDATRLETFTTYIAAWNHIRTDAVLDDAGLFFASSPSEFVDSVSGFVGTDSYREYSWQKTTNSPSGGESARLELEEEGTMEITVRGPMSGFLLYVYDGAGSRIGEINSGETLSIAVSGDAVYLDMGISQGTASAAIDVFARIMAVEECVASDPMCPAPMCLGDFEACMDAAECCDGMSCIIGFCADCEGLRGLTEACDLSVADQCCGALTCSLQSGGGGSTCCATADEPCDADAECCGEMTCGTGGYCVCRVSGESCQSARECCDGSVCDAGTCS